MELIDQDRPIYTALVGEFTADLADDQWLKIETSPRGEEVLNKQVPPGKVWHVRVHVAIEERDA